MDVKTDKYWKHPYRLKISISIENIHIDWKHTYRLKTSISIENIFIDWKLLTEIHKRRGANPDSLIGPFLWNFFKVCFWLVECHVVLGGRGIPAREICANSDFNFLSPTKTPLDWKHPYRLKISISNENTHIDWKHPIDWKLLTEIQKGTWTNPDSMIGWFCEKVQSPLGENFFKFILIGWMSRDFRGKGNPREGNFPPTPISTSYLISHLDDLQFLKDKIWIPSSPTTWSYHVIKEVW